MNCNKVEIWLDEQHSVRGVSLPADVSNHIATCKSCSFKLEALQQAYGFIEEQSTQGLSISKQNEIIAVLSNKEVKDSNKLIVLPDWFSKVAAVLIIGAGVSMGILFANNYLVAPSDETLWTDEFSMISENVEVSLFEE